MNRKTFKWVLIFLTAVFFRPKESWADELICQDIPNTLAKVEIDNFGEKIQINVFFPKKYQSFRFETIEFKLFLKKGECDECRKLVVSTNLRVYKHENYYRASLISGREKENEIELKAIYYGGCTSKMVLRM